MMIEKKKKLIRFIQLLIYIYIKIIMEFGNVESLDD